MAWVATAIVGSAVVGAAANIYSANKASDAQASAAEKASAARLQGVTQSNQLLQGALDTGRETLSPYRDVGAYGIEQLKANPNLMLPVDVPQEMLDLRKPMEFTQETLNNIPGYEFTVKQGLKAVQNSAAARGLGVSGAAQKGAADFATGTASKYAGDWYDREMANRQTAFGRYDTTLGRQIQQRQSAFDRLRGLIDVGNTAAGNSANLGAVIASGQSKNITGASEGVATDITRAGTAEAAGITRTGDAISNATNRIGSYAAYQGLYGDKTPADVATDKNSGWALPVQRQ